MSMVKKLHKFHQSKTGFLTFGLLELLLAYIFASFAIDTASMWTYLAAAIFSIGAILNFTNFFKSIHEKRSMKRKLKHAGARQDA